MNAAVDSDLERLRRELERLRAENVRLSRLLELRGQDTAPAPEQLSAAVTPPGLVGMSSPVADKLALYADRFRARADVYAGALGERPDRGEWVDARGGRRVAEGSRSQSGRLPAADRRGSLRASGWRRLRRAVPVAWGQFLPLLVVDFDGPAAMLDALAYAKAARVGGVPAALEVSQSGRG